MTASTKRILAIFLSLIGIFYIFVAFFNFIIPGWARMSNLRAEISEKRAALEQLQGLVLKAKEYLANRDELERRMRLIETALPLGPRIPELVAILNAIASKNGAILAQVRFDTVEYRAEPGTEEAGLTVSKVLVQANVVGTYPAIKGWLRDIESEFRLIDVNIISMQSTAGEEAARPDTPISVEVGLIAYWQN